VNKERKGPQGFARWSRRGRGCRCGCSCSYSCSCGRIWGLIFLWRLAWGLIWGPRLRGRCWDGLLYGLLNCHATRRTRSGLLPLLATTNEPGEEESDEEESDKCAHSNSQHIPPTPPYVSPSSPHGAIPSSIVVNESRVALLRRTSLPRTRVHKVVRSPRLLLPIDLDEQHPRLE
jgi:hypothetical protein